LLPSKGSRSPHPIMAAREGWLVRFARVVVESAGAIKKLSVGNDVFKDQIINR